MVNDIRSRTTKKMIRSAFHSLVEDGCREVTVRAICAASGISRATFYAHYSDLYDLIAEDEREALSQLGLEDFEHNYRDTQARAEIFLRILTHLDENEKMYSYYLSVHEKYFFSLVLRDIMTSVSEELIRRGLFSSREKARLSVLYHASGLLQTLCQWLEYGKTKPCSREEYARMLSEIA